MSDFAVLFVDDEPLTRKITIKLLGRHYSVLEASSGIEALDTLRKHDGGVGVMITDMKMENMDGMSLIQQVAQEFPGISIVASTGDLTNYDFDKMIASGELFAALEKPWDFAHAIETINSAMNACTVN